MLAVAERGIDLVIGSRYIPGGSVIGWPRRRTWLSRWGNRYAAIMLGLAINDATAGYRVYRTDALRAIGLDGIQAGGYGFQVEMTYRTVGMGLSVVEIPIQFRDRVAGTSKWIAASWSRRSSSSPTGGWPTCSACVVAVAPTAPQPLRRARRADGSRLRSTTARPRVRSQRCPLLRAAQGR